MSREVDGMVGQFTWARLMPSGLTHAPAVTALGGPASSMRVGWLLLAGLDRGFPVELDKAVLMVTGSRGGRRRG